MNVPNEHLRDGTAGDTYKCHTCILVWATKCYIMSQYLDPLLGTTCATEHDVRPGTGNVTNICMSDVLGKSVKE